MRHVGAQIVEQGLPGGEHRAVPDLLSSRRSAEAWAIFSAATAPSLISPTRAIVAASAASRPPKPPNSRDQLLGERLGVAAGDGQREQIFDQLMIEQGVRPALEQALAQPGAVPAAVFGSVGHDARLDAAGRGQIAAQLPATSAGLCAALAGPASKRAR